MTKGAILALNSDTLKMERQKQLGSLVSFALLGVSILSPLGIIVSFVYKKPKRILKVVFLLRF